MADEELNLRVTADTKRAVDNLEDVEETVGDLEDKPHEVEVTADTKAAEEAVSNLDKRLEGLTKDQQREILLRMSKQAERDLDRINRDLANAHKLGDDELQLTLNAKGDAEAKLKAIKAELGEVQDAAGDADQAVGDIGNKSSNGLMARFNNLGAGLAGKLVAGFAAAGVGAVLVDQLQRSWDNAGGLRRITNQFNLSGSESVRYGKIAADLYKNNWGAALTEVQRNVALTGQRIGASSNTELAKITAGIMAISETWGQEFDAVVRSTTQLLQNGLAPNAQAALDLITRAFQEGGDEAGDLLDTIDEYAQHWAAMGLSGEEALSIIVDGLQNGQRDADKLADAVKEMRIRVVEDNDAIRGAYKELGLDADTTREKFLAGGPAAREAYLQVLGALKSVSDPIARQRLAVQLIGTQFEDLGPTAVDSLLAIEGKLEDVNGATEDLADNIKATPWEDFQRRGESAFQRNLNKAAEFVLAIDAMYKKLAEDDPTGILSGIGQAASQGALANASDTADRIKGLFDDVFGTGTDVSPWFNNGVKIADALKDGIASGLSDAGDLAGVLDITADAVGRLAGTTDRGAVSFDTYEANAERVADQLGQQGLAGQAAIADQALSDLDERLSKKRAFLSLAEQLQRVREAHDAVGEAAGKSADEQIQAALNEEEAVLGLQEQVLRLLASYDDIPAQKRTEFYAAIDSGDVDRINAVIEELTRGRMIEIDIVPTVRTPAFSGAGATINAGAGTVRTTITPPQQISNTTIYQLASSPQQTYIDNGIEERRNGAA